MAREGQGYPCYQRDMMMMMMMIYIYIYIHQRNRENEKKGREREKLIKTFVERKHVRRETELFLWNA